MRFIIKVRVGCRVRLSRITAVAVTTPKSAGVAMRKLDRLQEAQECFQSVIEADPSFLASHRGLVDCAMTAQNFEDALKFCVNALEIAHDDTSLLTDKANVLLKLGRAEDALPSYEKVVAAEDASPQVQQLYAIALSQVAVAADKEGDLERAEELYSSAISIDATSTRLFNRAYLYMRTGRIDSAVAGFSAVLEIDADNSKARAALGTLLLQQQNYEQAVNHLKLASKACAGEEFADVTYNLGFALLKLARCEAAKAAFKKVLEVDPDNENAKNGLRAAQAHTEASQIAQPSPAQTTPAASEPPSAPVVTTPTHAAPVADAEVQEEPAFTAAAAASPSEQLDGDFPVFSVDALREKPFPPQVDSTQREKYLSVQDFQTIFAMDRDSFDKLPKWKRVSLKKKAGLF